jgi:protein tyrosine/serine phosphatase
MIQGLAPFNNADLIVPNLWLGNMRAASDENFLRQHNIEIVFNCTKDIPFHSSIRKRYRVPVDDNLEAEEIRNLELWAFEIQYKLMKEYKTGKPILIHCAAGMQRSAAVTAMFLISQYRCTTDEAIVYIKSKRPIAFLGNANFYKSIKQFENAFRKMLLEKNQIQAFPRVMLP